jgi:DNA-binding winged helix-turn-helix (wHTH) protein/TolB-like protein/tetratricopeptide (TPR) repeat protein
MTRQENNLYEFGPFRLDAQERVLTRDGEVVPLTPKAVDLLVALVENSGHVLSKDELMKRVWPDSFVEEANLSHHIFTLRKALGEDRSGAKYIETIPRRGYRFVASVAEIDDASNDLVVAERTRSHIVIDEEREAEAAGSYVEATQPRQLKARQLKALADGRPRNKVNLAVLAVCVAVIVLGAGAYFWMTSKPRQEQTGPGVRSIAVLPFKPLVADSRNESLELGMAETLISKLSPIKQLVVMPISAVRKYSGLEQDSIAAGQELGVDYVLEGNLQMVGEKTRATVRLLSVKDGRAVWTDKCDQACSTIFELQDGVAQQIAGTLALELTGDERKQLAKHYTENVEAYQLYVKGRFFWSKFTDEGIAKAIDYFQQAIDKDPTYALAYTGLANSYSVLGLNGPMSPKEALQKMKYVAEKAVELDDKLAQAHSALGGLRLFYEWDWAGAERAFKRAMELDPGYADSHELYGHLLRDMGRFDEALAEMRKAQELNPVSIIISGEYGATLFLARRYDQAIEELNKTLELDPNFAATCYALGLAYAHNGMYEKAVAESSKAVTLSGGSVHSKAALGQVYALSGKKAEAQKVIAELQQESKQGYVSPLDVALIYATLGQSDEAFFWLEKAYEERSCWLIELKSDPGWDKIRSDPRFDSLLGRVGLPK